jgi:hypothetical protein
LILNNEVALLPYSRMYRGVHLRSQLVLPFSCVYSLMSKKGIDLRKTNKDEVEKQFGQLSVDLIQFVLFNLYNNKEHILPEY